MAIQAAEELLRVVDSLLKQEDEGIPRIRVTNDYPKKASVIDYFQFVTGLNGDQCSKQLRRIVEAEPEVRSNLTEHQFPGQGQRKTWVTDAVGLVRLHQLLPAKYTTQFRKNQADLFVRFAGGDTSLSREIEGIRRLQEHAAVNEPDHPLRVFGEAVESGVTGSLNTQAAVPQIGDPMEDVEYLNNRVDSADTTNQLNAVMRRIMPSAGRDIYTRVQAAVSDSLLGSWPGSFKAKHNIPPRYSGRDIMTKPQLSVAYGLQQAGVMELLAPDSPYKNTDGDAFAAMMEHRCGAAKAIFTPFHGLYQDPTELGQVRKNQSGVLNVISNNTHCNITYNQSA